MWFWWFMLTFDLLTPITMIIGGWMMEKHTPKEINGFIGYRTPRSMKNKDTWNFAHSYCGKLWWKIGWILLVPSLIANIPFYGSSDDTIGVVGGILVAIQIAALVLSIFPTERALKKNFNADGTKKQSEGQYLL
jgi:uncharacterized membrane protein